MKKRGKSAAERMRKFRLKRLEIRRLKRKPRPKPPDQQLWSTESSDCSKGEEDFQVTCGASSDSSETESSGLMFGHMSMMGRQRVMEDMVTVAPPVLVPENYFFFGVYDGHGGTKVAEECREKMHKFIAKHVKQELKSTEEGDINWNRVMMESFRSMETEIEHECILNEPQQGAKRTIGSTATVMLIGKKEVVVANCGNSRVVLIRGGAVMPLSRDHRPDREDEKVRIEAAGGMIINGNDWRVEGVLSTSRSLGDRYLKSYVISEPEVNVVKRTRLDEVLIIGTNGLFNVVSNEFACDVVKRCLRGQIRWKEAESRVSMAATVLAKQAIAMGSKDNISVMIVRMK